MANNIVNNSAAYGVTNKKNVGKISFENKQIFSAKITGEGEEAGTIVLKTSDGWQFEGELADPVNFDPNVNYRFQVEGFKDGKLQIKLLSGNEVMQKEAETSFADIAKSLNFQLEPEDYILLKSMIKHDMPLTRENISNIKTLVDFRDRSNNNTLNVEQFINKYMDSKGIIKNSEEGINATKTLKDFFGELKNLSSDEIMTLLENNIEPSGDNIRSFLRVFKNENQIYNSIKELGEEFLKTTDKNNMSIGEEFISKADLEMKPEVSNSDVANFAIKQHIDITKENLENLKTLLYFRNALTESELSGDSIISKYLDKKNIDSDSNTGKNIKSNLSEIFDVIKNSSIDELTYLFKQGDNSLSINNSIKSDSPIYKILKEIKVLDEPNNSIKKGIPKNVDNLSSLVKSEIDSKFNEVKDIINKLIEAKANINSQPLENLSKNINDFKIFNTVSNQYYYADVPIRVSDYNYNFKLMIKDDRQNGKTIDSKNIKIVASVKTINMGTIDAYVKVLDKKMNIDIKCEEKWIKILSYHKENLFQKLSTMGYNVTMQVEEKDESADIINTREFFQDNYVGGINVTV